MTKHHGTGVGKCFPIEAFGRASAQRCRHSARLRAALGLSILLSCLLGGCGFVPRESKLVGSWQAELPAPVRLVYTFHEDHTYTMTIAGQGGSINGRWKLEANLLSHTPDSFSAGSVTSALPAVPGIDPQQRLIIVRLTDSVLVWRSSPLEKELRFKRINPSSSARP